MAVEHPRQTFQADTPETTDARHRVCVAGRQGVRVDFCRQAHGHGRPALQYGDSSGALSAEATPAKAAEALALRASPSSSDEPPFRRPFRLTSPWTHAPISGSSAIGRGCLWPLQLNCAMVCHKERPSSADNQLFSVLRRIDFRRERRLLQFTLIYRVRL